MQATTTKSNTSDVLDQYRGPHYHTCIRGHEEDRGGDDHETFVIYNIHLPDLQKRINQKSAEGVSYTPS